MYLYIKASYISKSFIYISKYEIYIFLYMIQPHTCMHIVLMQDIFFIDYKHRILLTQSLKGVDRYDPFQRSWLYHNI